MSVLFRGKTLIHALSSNLIVLTCVLLDMVTFHARLNCTFTRLKTLLRYSNNDFHLFRLIWHCEHNSYSSKVLLISKALSLSFATSHCAANVWRKENQHTLQAVLTSCTLPFCIWIQELNSPKATRKRCVLYQLWVKIVVTWCPSIWEACYHTAVSLVWVQTGAFAFPCISDPC